MNDSSRHIFLLAFLSLGLLMLLSAVPWSRLTGNVIKDFNLFEDLQPRELAVLPPSEDIDPAPTSGSQDIQADNLQPEIAIADSTEVDSTDVDSIVAPVVPVEASISDGTAMIENYTGSSQSFEHFRQALAEVGQRVVRVAFVGDSYIEGDIFSQNLRDLLQQRYGGSGVGFMAMHSDFPGFRRTVRQSDKGWKLHDIRTFGRRDTLRSISSSYARAEGDATASFEGTDEFGGTTGWSQSRFLFLAPSAGTISLKLSDGTTADFEVEPSGDVQVASLPGSTDKLVITSDVPGLVGLGTYLDGASGIQVDCMSVRGNSGKGLSVLNYTLCSQMSQHVPYDLIILEFGMNAISNGQTEYEWYSRTMEKAIARVRSCHPQADILLLGVGDRGVKRGGEVCSMPEAVAMNNAQRKAAVRAKALFWDSRASMGGDGSIADWRRRKLVNADYVHLNYDGGAELARLLDKAIQLSLNE